MKLLPLFLVVLLPVAHAQYDCGYSTPGYSSQYGRGSSSSESHASASQLANIYSSLAPQAQSSYVQSHRSSESIMEDCRGYAHVPVDGPIYPNLPLKAELPTTMYGIIVNGVLVKSPYSEWQILLSKLKDRHSGAPVFDDITKETFLLP